MTNHMHHNQPFIVKKFIDHSVITDTQLEHSLEFSREHLEIGVRKIFSQPMYSFNDSPSNGLIELSQLLGGGIQQADTIHASVKPQPFRDRRQRLSSFTRSHSFPLAKQPILDGLL